MTDKKKFIFSNLLSLVLGIVIGAGSFGIASNINKPAKVPEQAIILPDYGGAVIGEAQENGIQMMKTAIPVEEYAAYGVSEQAEKAYTITATVKPDDATNKKVNWSLAFANAESTWAKGKNLSDYVTVTASGTTNSTAVLTCKQAFGEQILLTATSDDDSTKSAVCTVDYAQKVTNASLSFGSLTLENNGTLSPKFQIAADMTGSGGKAALNYTSDVYTIADTFTVSYDIDYEDISKAGAMKGDYSFKDISALSEAIENNDDVFFDLSFFALIGTQVKITGLAMPIIIGNNTTPYSDTTLMEDFLAAYQGFDGDIGGDITITATITGKYSSFTYTGTIAFDDYVNGTSIESVNLDKDNIIIS